MRLDWYEKQHHPLIESLAAQLFEAIPPPESLRGVNKLHREKSLKSLSHLFISALYSNHFRIGGSDKVSMPKSPRYFDIKDVSGEKLKLSHRYCIEVFIALEQLKWIRVTLGKKGINHTFIEPSSLLETLFNEIGFLWTPQEPKPEEELIVLRDLKRDESGSPLKGKLKIDIPLPDYKLKSTHLNNLKRINRALMSHCYHMDLSDKNIKELKTKSNEERKESSGVILLSGIQLSRIFSRGSVELGGRFYRGWWQSIPSKHRPHIRIDGYKTDEIDFSGIGIRILYSEVGAKYKGADPYDIGLDNWKGSKDNRRKAVKKAMNALINDIDGKYSFGKEEIQLLKMNTKQFKEKVQNTHKPIAEFFQTEKGLKSQYIDSQIAEHVMLNMINNDAITLPIHDSFIVRLGHRKLILESMRKACIEILGFDISTTQEYIKLNEHFNLPKSEVLHLQDAPEEAVVNLDALKDRLFSSDFSLMDSYIDSFELHKGNVQL